MWLPPSLVQKNRRKNLKEKEKKKRRGVVLYIKNGQETLKNYNIIEIGNAVTNGNV